MRARQQLELLAAEVTAELSERQRVEKALREHTEVVETINRVGHMLAAELDLHKRVQAVTDAATALTGAQFGAFLSPPKHPLLCGINSTLFGNIRLTTTRAAHT